MLVAPVRARRSASRSARCCCGRSAALGFSGLVAGWALIAALVVLPAALVAGLQFPLLIALLGRGRARVGRDVGVTYAANTLGAIVGSLAGGFGLLPLLGALGCWRAVSAAARARGRAGAARGAARPQPPLMAAARSRSSLRRSASCS